MAIDSQQKLHWTQRIALVRHNLHAARRTGDFTFFKTLQAHALIDGTDHVAILHTVLGDDADSVLSTLDNLNAGIAYVHQDAFKAVYDGAKATMYKDNSPSSRRSLLRVDICQQRDMADHAIDKTTNSAVNLIETQPAHSQDSIANAWITGATIVADAVEVCLAQMDSMEESLDDFIRLEYSWGCIQSAVDASISALRGIFSLMASETPPPPPPPKTRNFSVSSAYSSDTPSFRSRASSTASAFGMIKRAFSNAHLQPPPSAPRSVRTGSVSSLGPHDNNPKGFRLSMNSACPTRLPGHNPTLTTIPPTPAAHDTSIGDMSPFGEKNDYFAFDLGKGSDTNSKRTSASEDLMQLENLDPLSPTPTADDIIKMPVPLTLRRLSESFGMSPPAPIAV